MTKACNNCGKDISRNTKFCSECGSKQQLACSACDSALNDDDRFCGKCGASTQDRDSGYHFIASLPSAFSFIQSQINYIKIEAANEDGNREVTVHYSVINTLKEVINFVRIKALLFNDQGVLIEEVSYDEDDPIYISETKNLSLQFCNSNEDILGDPSKVKVELLLKLCTNRVVIKDKMVLPATAQKLARSAKAPESNGPVNLVDGHIWYGLPDEDGDVQIHLSNYIQNLTSSLLPRFRLDAQIFDPKGNELIELYNFVEIKPNDIQWIEATAYLKAKEIKGANIKFTAQVAIPLAFSHAVGDACSIGRSDLSERGSRSSQDPAHSKVKPIKSSPSDASLRLETGGSFTIDISGASTECVLGSISEEKYEFWSERQDALGEHIGDSDNDMDIADEFSLREWYEYDDTVHESGPLLGEATITISNADGDEIWSCPLALAECESRGVGIHRARSFKKEDLAGSFYFFGRTLEKGAGFSGTVQSPYFQPSLLAATYDDILGTEIVYYLQYDGEDIENEDSSTRTNSSEFEVFDTASLGESSDESDAIGEGRIAVIDFSGKAGCCVITWDGAEDDLAQSQPYINAVRLDQDDEYLFYSPRESIVTISDFSASSEGGERYRIHLRVEIELPAEGEDDDLDAFIAAYKESGKLVELDLGFRNDEDEDLDTGNDSDYQAEFEIYGESGLEGHEDKDEAEAWPTITHVPILPAGAIQFHQSKGPFELSISRTAFDGPDKDGDVRFEVNGQLTNRGSEDVELIFSKFIVANAQGIAVSIHTDELEEFASADESVSLDLNSGYLKAIALGTSGKPKDAQMILELRPCSCSLTELPTLSSPSAERLVTHTAPIDLGRGLVVQSLSVYAQAPDEDGECKLDVRCLIDNPTTTPMPRVELNILIKDSNGRDIKDSTNQVLVSPNSKVVLEESIWGVKQSYLSGGSISFTLKVFHALGIQTLSWAQGVLPQTLEPEIGTVDMEVRGQGRTFLPPDQAELLPKRTLDESHQETFSARVTSATFEEPDDDGEVRYSIDVSVENQGDKTIDLVLAKVFVLHSSGLLLTSTTEDTEDSASKGETIELSASCWGLNIRELNNEPHSAQIYAQISPSTRISRDLATLPVPKPREINGKGSAIALTETLAIESMVVMTEPPDGGECQVTTKVFVRNEGLKPISRFMLETRIVDKDGEELEISYSTEEIPSGARVLVEDNIFGLKPKKIDGASIEISVKSYESLGVAIVSAPSPSKSDD